MMDVSDHHQDGEVEEQEQERNGDRHRPRQLPHDLPTSLNDRKAVTSYGGETEMYDAWQGME